MVLTVTRNASFITNDSRLDPNQEQRAQLDLVLTPLCHSNQDYLADFFMMEPNC